jgi:hypothetical protein
MYRIIGGDQKEYGPVTADELRRWIAEGRANAQTQVLGEGAAEWKPLSAFPEFADLLNPPSATSSGFASGGTGSVSPDEILARDYSLDIGDCITRGWELVKQRFGPTVGAAVLVLVVIIGINQLLGLLTRPAINGMIYHRQFSVGAILVVCGVSILSTPIYTIFMAGIYNYYLKLIRGESVGFGAAFSGFGPAIGQLAVLGLVTSVLTLLAFCFCVLPGIYLSIAWTFAVPLVIDRGMNFWDAMELSRKVVSKHWFLVFAFVLVIGLIACIGLIGCCIGIFVTSAIAWMARMYAYEAIFGRQAP